jgi:4-amino-4-deoxy-L-arabinose transferase-like glycosyltransferase
MLWQSVYDSKRYHHLPPRGTNLKQSPLNALLTSNVKRNLFVTLLLTIIIAFSVIVRLRFLAEPFDCDEGWYAYMGQEMLRGSLLYRDLPEMKPPGGFYLYALGIALFGPTVIAVRCYSLLFSMASIIGVFFVARKIAGTAAGLWGAFCLAILSASPLMLGGTTNLEVFLIPPLLAAVWFHVGDAPPGRFGLFLSGVCIGSALFIKQVAAPFVLLLALFSFYAAPERKFSRQLCSLAWYVVAIIAVSGFAVIWMASQGILTDFIHYNFTVPYRYVSKNEFSGPQLELVLIRLAPELISGSVVAIPTTLYYLVHRKDRGLLAAALLLPAALLAVFLPGKNFPHYFVVLMPFLALMTGIGLARLKQVTYSLRLTAYGILCLVLIWYGTMVYPFYFVMTPHQLSDYKYGPTFVQSEKIAEYLRNRTKAGEIFYQFGLNPELYFLTGTRAPLPFAMSISTSFMPDPQRAVTAMLAKLTLNPPRYMTYDRECVNFPGNNEVVKLINSMYVKEADFGSITLYRYRDKE